MKKVYNLNNLKQVNEFAKTFVKLIKPQQIISLKGTLGSGKTTFVKALMHNLNKDIVVTSPTFAIANEYNVHNINIVHIDAYRLSSYEDFLDEYFNDQNTLFIEWFDKLNLPNNILDFELEFKVISGEQRQIILRSNNENFISNPSI